jgi:CheY-like chemotaxis protein
MMQLHAKTLSDLFASALVLPLDPPAPRFSGRSKSQEDEADGAAKLRVVVVDDESTIAETLVEILNGEGFEAVAALNGNQAIELAQSFKPDIVISDVVIPGRNGVDTGIQIRELLPHCRVILFSGQAATADLLKEARQRGHEFQILAKPIRPQNLLAIIRGGRPS